MRALGDLYARYSVMVQKAVVRTMPRISDADREDLVHDVFLSLLKLVNKFDRARVFRPWLYGVAIKKTQNFRRKRSVRALLLRQRATNSEDNPVHPPADGQLENAEIMEKGLSSLPAGQKDVLILHAVEGFKGEEIAEILEIEINTVWSRLHRARKTMLQLLENEREEPGGHENGV